MASCNNQEWNACQSLAYTDGMIRALKDKVKWLYVIDSDEFLVPRTKNTLLDVLKPYEKDNKLGGVRVMWVMLGTSHVKKIPDNELLIESLTLNQGYQSGMWKSICRPDRVNCGTLVGCHNPEYLHGYHDATLSFEEMQCNHYWTRDEDYLFNIKIPRKMKLSDGVSIDTCLKWNESFNKETVAGDAILRFIPALRKKMGFPSFVDCFKELFLNSFEFSGNVFCFLPRDSISLSTLFERILAKFIFKVMEINEEILLKSPF